MGPAKLPQNYLARKRTVILCFLAFLLFLDFTGGIATANEGVKNLPVTSAGGGLNFAIADFDGDLQPDSASIQSASSSLETTDYWVQLRLTKAGRQSIELAGPAGGLLIEARDVNGDHAIDLILTTAWFDEPVAILLNNGHGLFSRVGPSEFPQAFSEPKTKWGSAVESTTVSAGILSQRSAVDSALARLTHSEAQSRLNSHPRWSFPLKPFLFSHQSRAPPA